jgi:hypothetical protein
MIAIMAANRKRSCGSVIIFSIGRHDGDRVVVLLTFLLAAMMAIVW